MPNATVAVGDSGLLDNPVWHALTGAHRGFARVCRRPANAYRYRDDVAPFAALRDVADPAAWHELAELCGYGGRAALDLPDVVAAPKGWTVTTVFRVAQMVAPTTGLTDVAGTDEVVPLGRHDVDEMTALAERTRPGPFASSTVEMGGYVGVRRAGRLVAMAGRRLRLPGWIEISAVCTHPDHRGDGLSRLLIDAVDAAIRREGHRAFLHVLHDNTRALEVYRGLGFTTRADMTMTVLRPTG